MSTLLELLQMAVDQVEEAKGYLPTFYVGDFNAHVGNAGCIPEELTVGTNLFSNREAEDHIIDDRGRKLCNFMQDNVLILVNGRIENDHPGRITFYGRGRSTINFVWANTPSLELIESFGVTA